MTESVPRKGVWIYLCRWGTSGWASHARRSKLQTFLRTGRPHTEILPVANTDIDHIVMETHGESPITRSFLGRVSEAVVRRAPVSTTIVPETTTVLRDRDCPAVAPELTYTSPQEHESVAFSNDSTNFWPTKRVNPFATGSHSGRLRREVPRRISPGDRGPRTRLRAAFP
ncbi:universal stress protein [Halostagnicola bangensis]